MKLSINPLYKLQSPVFYLSKYLFDVERGKTGNTRINREIGSYIAPRPYITSKGIFFDDNYCEVCMDIGE